METKGQITLFVIVMIVLALLVGFFFYVLSTGQESKMESEGSEETQQYLNRQKIKHTLQTCFDEAWTNSLEVLGRQAGFIYEDQKFNTPYGTFTLKGNFDDKSRIIEYKGENYTILMTTPDFLDPSKDDSYYKSRYSIIDPQPIPAIEQPIYPCKPPVNTTLSGLPSVSLNRDTYDIDDGDESCPELYDIRDSIRSFTNMTELPPLCKRAYPDPSGGVLCDCVGKACKNSTQAMMENFTRKYFRKCFKSVHESDIYEVNLQDIKIETLLSKKNLQMSINSTINATSETDSQQLIFSRVNANQKDIKVVGLMEYLLDDILEQDSRNISYDLQTSFKNLTKNLKYSQNAKSTVEYFNKGGGDYSLVTLIVDSSNRNINGEPFKFSFVREDRPPALSSIGDEDIDPSSLHSEHDDKFNVTVCGGDPDEDTVHLSLKGIPTPGRNTTKWNYYPDQCSTTRKHCKCWEVETEGNDNPKNYYIKASIKDPHHKDTQSVEVSFS